MLDNDNELLDNQNTVEEVHTIILEESDRNVYIGTSSVIGKRNEQQDAIKSDTFYDYAENKRIISVLCDGMGGLDGGAKASNLCASIVYDTFHGDRQFETISEFYKYAIYQADKSVVMIRSDDGSRVVGAGTTLASVVIDEDELHWAAVGDSRIYIIRGEEILCITKDHNLLMLLNEQVEKGEITQEEANRNPKREALISFIGIDGIRYININNKGLKLVDGDYIVLCSDGLYRSVSEDEIKQIVRDFSIETDQTAEALTSYAISKNLKNQDNTSVVVIAYQDLG